MNPQYLITLPGDSSQSISLIVSLMQEDFQNSCNYITWIIFKVYYFKISIFNYFSLKKLLKVHDSIQIDKNASTSMRFYANQLDHIFSFKHHALRDITERIRLSPGNYVIIPSKKEVFEDNQSCKFLLRIFSKLSISS